MKFKPTLFPTLFTITALFVLLSLGTWQVYRLQWKNNLVATVNEKIAMPAVEMSPDVDINQLQYRKVHLQGEFLNDKEVHLFTGAKKFKGEMGYDILTPMRLADGRVVLVDRGWLPHDKKEPQSRPETLLSGIVDVVGMLHKGEIKGRFTPDNDIEKNLWFWIDIPAIENYTGTKLQNLYVRQLKEGDSNVLPIAGDAVITQRNDHLQYAVTWYGLAIVLLVIYFVYHIRRD
ncbi:MAG: hypothetical protein K0R98_611 [Rickettsiaceae bacterium]|jgi:surfeit locus 1 family protein|nr:hypothetical protein [Rickettsiaceae bacterium]